MSPTPFPWWLWILAGLWTGGLVLRGVWSGSREGRWFLDVLVGVYTVLLAYMAAAATGTDADRLSRAIAWVCGTLAVGGGVVCLLATTRRWQTGGWMVATLGVAGLSLSLAAPELAVLCVAAGILGAMRSSQAVEREENHRGDLRPPARPEVRDPWLVAVLGTVVGVAWLGSVQFALRVESQRGGLSRRETVLPAAPSPGDSTASRWPAPALLLAGVLLGLAVRESRLIPVATTSDKESAA